MERVYDLLGMVSVLVIMVLFLSPELSASGEQAELISNLKVYGGLAGIVSVVSMLIFFVLISYQSKYREARLKSAKKAQGEISRAEDNMKSYFFDS